MKLRPKKEYQQLAINNSSNIDFKDFMKLYKKCTEKLFSFLVSDATWLADTLVRFRHNILESLLKVTMAIDEKVRDNNNRETANTILTKKQRKHWHYHQEKFINMNILLVNKYYLLLIKVK